MMRGSVLTIVFVGPRRLLRGWRDRRQLRRQQRLQAPTAVRERGLRRRGASARPTAVTATRATRTGCVTLATGEVGDACASEVDCARRAVLPDRRHRRAMRSSHLVATCTAQNTVGARPAGSPCDADGDCRNGTCALGHCVDLCAQHARLRRRARVARSSRASPPTAARSGRRAVPGCLPVAAAFLSWTIPSRRPSRGSVAAGPATPHARSRCCSPSTIRTSWSAPRSLTSPTGQTLVREAVHADRRRCAPTQDTQLDQYYSPTNLVRHLPAARAVGARDAVELERHPAARRLRDDGRARSAATAARRLGDPARHRGHQARHQRRSSICTSTSSISTTIRASERSATPALNAPTAQTAPFFQNDYLGELRGDLRAGGHRGRSARRYDDVVGPPRARRPRRRRPRRAARARHARRRHQRVLRAHAVAGRPPGVRPEPRARRARRHAAVRHRRSALDTLCYRTWAAARAAHRARDRALHGPLPQRRARHVEPPDVARPDRRQRRLDGQPDVLLRVAAAPISAAGQRDSPRPKRGAAMKRAGPVRRVLGASAAATRRHVGAHRSSGSTR